MSQDYERDSYLVEDLELRFAKLAEDKADLERELIRAKEQLIKNSQAFKSETESLKEQLANKDIEMDEKEDEINLLKEQMRSQQEIMEKLSTQNDRLKRSSQKLRLDNEMMEEEVSKLRNERKIIYDRLDNVKLTINESTGKLRDKDKLLMECQGQKRILQKAINELKRECEQLSKQLETKSSKIRELQQCVQADLENHLNYATSNGRLVQQLNELQSIKTLHQQKIEQLEQERDTFKDKLFEYSQELELKNAETRDGTLECESKMVEINGLVGQLSSTMDRSKLIKQGRRKVNRQIRNSLSYLERVIDSYH